MILPLVMGTVLVLVTIGLAAIALSDAPETSGVNRSLAALETISSAPKEMVEEVDKPFGERVLEPLQARALLVGRRLSGYQRTYDRSEQMQKDLPDAIDLMTISVESRLGFDAAVQQVARNTICVLDSIG